MSIPGHNGPEFIKLKGSQNEAVYVLKDSVEVIVDLSMIPDALTSIGVRLKASNVLIGVNTTVNEVLDLLDATVREPSHLTA